MYPNYMYFQSRCVTHIHSFERIRIPLVAHDTDTALRRLSVVAELEPLRPHSFDVVDFAISKVASIRLGVLMLEISPLKFCS